MITVKIRVSHTKTFMRTNRTVSDRRGMKSRRDGGEQSFSLFFLPHEAL